MKAKTIDIPTSIYWLVIVILLAFFTSALDINAIDTKTTPEMKYVSLALEEQTEALSIKSTNVIMIHRHNLKHAQIYAEQKAAAALAAQKAAAQAAALKAAEEARYSQFGVCALNSSTKTYMDYRAIGMATTQGRILASMNINSDGLISDSEGFIAVALGSYYGNLGSRYRITTDTGQVFKVIKVDAKSDSDTTNGCLDGHGGMVEFIIASNLVANAYPQVSLSGNFNSLTQFSGNIIKIEAYN